MISCVVLNYNDYERSISTAVYLSQYTIVEKVVIVDNHSTDNSYDEMLKIQNSKIDVIQSARNGGYGYGNNYGIRYIVKKIGSPYVLIINPDVRISEYAIDKLLQCIQNDNSCAVVSCKQILSNGKANMSYWNILTTLEIVFSGTLFLSKLIYNVYIT